MSVEEKVPMSRTSITMVVVVLLCVAGFAYSQGWLYWSNSSYETESDKVGTEQTINQEKMQDHAAPVTQQTKDSAATPTE
jgi:hypothetical protein